MPPQPHILVTNDDGIDSHFLRLLVESLQTRYRITIAAPMGEQSWIGRAVSRNREVHLAEYHSFPGVRAFALDGTPSDCVNIALSHLLDDLPDAVCSGINFGFNATVPHILSSGTIAGAMEGAFWGLPAFAFSLHLPKTEFERVRKAHGKVKGAVGETIHSAAGWALRFVDAHIEDASDTPVVHNINFPTNTHPESLVEHTEPAPFQMGPLFTPKTDASFHFRYGEGPSLAEGPYDYHALMAKRISYSRLDISQIGKFGSAPRSPLESYKPGDS